MALVPARAAKNLAMYLSRFLSMHALWVAMSSVMQPYPLVRGHYDVCKTQIYTEEGKVWDYMACQPESTDMTKYLKVRLDPPDITCGDPPETFCAMVRQPVRIDCVVVRGGFGPRAQMRRGAGSVGGRGGGPGQPRSAWRLLSSGVTVPRAVGARVLRL